MDSTNEELLQLVRSLQTKVEALETEVRAIRLISDQNVPDEVMVAIAAAVAGYLGFRAKKRQAHFTTNRNWQATTRRSQLSHAPLHLR